MCWLSNLKQKGVLYMSVSKNKFILGQFPYLFKWTSVCRHPVCTVYINIVLTCTPQKTQGKVAVGRRGLISSVAQKPRFAWLLSWWNPVPPHLRVCSLFHYPLSHVQWGCFPCSPGRSSREDVSTDSRQIILESVGSEAIVCSRQSLEFITLVPRLWGSD